MMAKVKKGITLPKTNRGKHNWLHPLLTELEPDVDYGLEINCANASEFAAIKALIYRRNTLNPKCKFTITSNKESLTLWVGKASVNGNGKQHE